LTTVFYVKKGRKNLIQKYDDLYNIIVGVADKTEYFSPFNDDPKIQKEVVSREILLIRLLNGNRVDSIIGTHPQLEYDINLNGFGGKFEQADYRPNNDVQIYIGFSKKSPFASKIELFNQEIIKLKSEGEIQTIFDNYLKSK
ncbi:MAG: ABC transporter substrate-binding protein, partial [Deltaproteobacteria bacterium]|nr:ABC transporter substrate-binding protein [Deltaproteobacteria bacterium]